MVSSSSEASSPTSSDAAGDAGTSTTSPTPVPKRSTQLPHSLSTANEGPSPSSSSPALRESPVRSASRGKETEVLNDEYYEGLYHEIRFGSYRTAAKLRSLQYRTGLVHIDIWNMIEAFRENGLNTAETRAAVKRSKLEVLVGSLYGSLAKRLPPSEAMSGSVKNMASWLLTWIVSTFSDEGDAERHEKGIRVRSLKTLLATLCSGKLMDKLRYIFSQLADANGHLVHSRFRQFLKDVSKIPISVGEYDSGATDKAQIFDANYRVTVNDFLETMMSDPEPQCLSWLLVLHRVANAEHSSHNVTCGSCGRKNFRGLRYKSDRANYHLCQGCFWSGKIGSKHKEDVFKEYSSHKGGCAAGSSGSSASNSGGLSLIDKSTFSCLQDKSDTRKMPRFPDKPEQTMDLSNMVPASPPPAAHRYGQRGHLLVQSHPPDDEHGLIARYAKQLACQEQQLLALESIDPDCAGRHALLHSRQLVRDLEKKNREIMHDINKLREQSRQQKQRLVHLRDGRISQMSGDPDLLEELEGLRHHKDELDSRLAELQATRRDLMQELEELMKLLKVSQPGDPLVPVNGGPSSSSMVMGGTHPDTPDMSGFRLEQFRLSANPYAYPSAQALGFVDTKGTLFLPPYHASEAHPEMLEE